MEEGDAAEEYGAAIVVLDVRVIEVRQEDIEVKGVNMLLDTGYDPLPLLEDR